MTSPYEPIVIPDSVPNDAVQSISTAPKQYSNEIIDNYDSQNLEPIIIPDEADQSQIDGMLNSTNISPVNPIQPEQGATEKFNLSQKFTQALELERSPELTPSHTVDAELVPSHTQDTVPTSDTSQSQPQSDTKSALIDKLVEITSDDKSLYHPIGKVMNTMAITKQYQIGDNWGDEVSKHRYLMRTAWGMSLTGTVMRGTLKQELDPVMEGQLNVFDKVIRTAEAMGPDFWLLGLGGTLFRAGNATRSVPLIEGSTSFLQGQAAASFGFYEAIRRVYINNLMTTDQGKEGFIDLLGSSIYDGLKGAATGLLLGKGHEIRSNLFNNASDAIVGFSKASAALLPEAASIAAFQSQLEKPGVLPDKEDFAVSMGLILGFESFGQVRNLMGKLGEDPVFNKASDAYKRYGVHPETLFNDAIENPRVLEDIINIRRNTIRDYEVDGGLPEKQNPISEGIKNVYDESKKSTSTLVNDETSGQTTIQQNTKIAQLPPNTVSPIPIYEGELHEILSMPDGRKIAVPLDPERSLSLSEKGLINVPTAVVFGNKILDGLKIKAGSAGDDPYLASSYGYFSRPELGRVKRIDELAKHIKRKEARIRRFKAQGLDSSGEEAVLSKLTKKIVELNSIETDYQGSEGKIVINRILSETRPERQLATILHEIGHVMSYANEGWEQGKSVGVSDFFYKTMSGYPGIIGDIISYAKDNNLRYEDIAAEAKMLSRLWRPTDPISASGEYRSKGSELIADVVSVSLHRPDIIETFAPSLHNAMQRYYEARPSVSERVKELKDWLETGKDLDGVEDVIKSNFASEEELLRSQTDITSQKRKSMLASGMSKMGGWLVDHFQLLWDTSRQSVNLHNDVQRYQFRGTIKQGYISKLGKLVVEPMLKSGMTNEDIGLALFYNRVMNDPKRANLFNMYGIDPVIAEKRYAELVKKPEVEAAIKSISDIRKDTIIKEIENSGLFGDDFIALVKSNESYARFADLEHFTNWIEEGNFNPLEKKITKALTGSEAERIKQVGSLGGVRNPLSATIQQDLYLFDSILKDKALKTFIDDQIASGDLPVIPDSEFNLVKRDTPEMLKGYSDREFTTVSLPERRLDSKTGKYHTVRTAWKIPTDISDLFMSKPVAVQEFISNIASHGFRELISEVVKPEATGRERVASAGAAAAKGIMKVNDIRRFFAIMGSGSFQLANFLSYDPIRTLVNLPNTIENVPLSGKQTLPLHYGKALYDLTKAKISGELSPALADMLNRGIFATHQRFTEDSSNTVLTERLLDSYGASGFNNRVHFKNENLILGSIDRIGSFLQGTLDVLDSTSKYAADSWIREKQGKGELSEYTPEEIDTMLREQIGSPAYAIKGDISSAANMIAPFFSSIAMALRGDLRAFKARPTHWMLNAGIFVIPSIIQGLALAGVFDGTSKNNNSIEDVINGTLKTELNTGPSISEILATQDELTHNSNWIVPLGIDKDTGDGVTFTFPLPQNPAQRLMHTATLGLIKAAHELVTNNPNDKEARDAWDYIASIGIGAIGSITNVGGSMSPDITPAFSIPRDAVDLMRTGNVYNAFFNKMKYSENLHGAADKGKAIFDNTLQSLAVPKSLRNISDTILTLNNPTKEDTEQSMTDQVLKSVSYVPFLGDGFNRFIRKGNTGLVERSWKDSDSKEANSIERRKLVDEAISEGKSLDSDKREQLVQLVNSGEISKQLIKSRLKKAGVENLDNKYLQNILKYGNNGIENAVKASRYSPKAKEALETLTGKRE